MERSRRLTHLRGVRAAAAEGASGTAGAARLPAEGRPRPPPTRRPAGARARAQNKSFKTHLVQSAEM